MYIFEWCILLKCSSKCPCTCILTAIIHISNKIGSILTNCMSNECIHTHSNLAKSGIWSIDCEIWDMGYWGVKNLGYGIWAPLCHPPPPPYLPPSLTRVTRVTLVRFHTVCEEPTNLFIITIIIVLGERFIRFY